jgi:threonyl-tRNA synthetase
VGDSGLSTYRGGKPVWLAYRQSRIIVVTNKFTDVNFSCHYPSGLSAYRSGYLSRFASQNIERSFESATLAKQFANWVPQIKNPAVKRIFYLWTARVKPQTK